MGILVLKRNPGQSIVTNTGLKVTVLSVHGPIVRLGIECPPAISVFRKELVDRAVEQGEVFNWRRSDAQAQEQAKEADE
jgi:carbon storage regulator